MITRPPDSSTMRVAGSTSQKRDRGKLRPSQTQSGQNKEVAE